jgi:hypothetical protein
MYCRRRIGASINTASTISRQRVQPNHWSRRVTANNPHGFTDKVFARLCAIEDPAEREKEEKKLLDNRRWNDKYRSNDENAARIRDQKNEKKRQQKINAG